MVWTSDLDGKQLRLRAEKTLCIRSMERSSHYGLVLWCDLGHPARQHVGNELVPEEKK
jgi:hypothetical protein